MAGSTTSTLDDLLPSIIQEAMFVAQEQSIMRGLVRNYSLAPGQGKVVNVPIYPKQTAAALTEGEEISNTAVSTSTATLTVATNAIRTLVTDLARTASASNVVADMGRLFGEAIAQKIDSDLMALFTGFSVGAGDATTTLSAATVATAVAKLRAVGVPSNDLAIVLNPYVAYDLKSNLTNAFANPGAGMIQNDAMKQGYLGQLFGVPVYPVYPETVSAVSAAQETHQRVYAAAGQHAEYQHLQQVTERRMGDVFVALHEVLAVMQKR